MGIKKKTFIYSIKGLPNMEVQISSEVRKNLVSAFADEKEFCGYGLLTGKVEGDRVIVEGVIVPTQERSPEMVNVEGEEIKRAAILAIIQDRKVIGTVNYHGNFTTYESTMERENRKSLSSQLSMQNAPSVVINVDGELSVYQ